jgi:hypothetical protein
VCVCVGSPELPTQQPTRTQARPGKKREIPETLSPQWPSGDYRQHRAHPGHIEDGLLPRRGVCLGSSLRLRVRRSDIILQRLSSLIRYSGLDMERASAVAHRGPNLASRDPILVGEVIRALAADREPGRQSDTLEMLALFLPLLLAHGVGPLRLDLCVARKLAVLCPDDARWITP